MPSTPSPVSDLGEIDAGHVGHIFHVFQDDAPIGWLIMPTTAFKAVGQTFVPGTDYWLFAELYDTLLPKGTFQLVRPEGAASSLAQWVQDVVQGSFHTLAFASFPFQPPSNGQQAYPFADRWMVKPNGGAAIAAIQHDAMFSGLTWTCLTENVSQGDQVELTKPSLLSVPAGEFVQFEWVTQPAEIQSPFAPLMDPLL